MIRTHFRKLTWNHKITFFVQLKIIWTKPSLFGSLWIFAGCTTSFVCLLSGLCSRRGRWIDVSRLQGPDFIGTKRGVIPAISRNGWWNWMEIWWNLWMILLISTQRCRESTKNHKIQMLVVEFQEFPCEIPYQQKHVLHPSRKVARHGARVEQHR